MWHEATERFRQRGELEVVGLIQEQHPDRCALFMQWKQMDFPILCDPLNQLAVAAVPIAVLLDEAGIVQAVRPGLAEVEEFVGADPVETDGPVAVREPDLASLRMHAAGASRGSVMDFADAAVLWGGSLDEAIHAYDKAISLHPDDGIAHFRRGVALKRRAEAAGDVADFQAAVDAWSDALELNPNQYIWRRRIQQYGPRLDKPYPFYDWVDEARAAIVQRGENPVELRIEPAGAELASPARQPGAAGTDSEPSANARIERDDELVSIRIVQVPATGRATAERVHLLMEPVADRDAHWNNEAEGLEIWISPSEGFGVSARRLVAPNPASAVSDELRHVEFEVYPPPRAEAVGVVAGYALYYVCEGADGRCLYRRQDFQITIGD